MKGGKEREDMLQEKLSRKRGRRSRKVVIEEERNEGETGGVKRQMTRGYTPAGKRMMSRVPLY